MSTRAPSIEPYGDFAFYLHFPGGGYDAKVSAYVLALAARLRAGGIWRDVIAGYDSLLASFDPALLNSRNALERLHAALELEDAALAARSKMADEASPVEDQDIVEIPVYYGGESGPDMENIMARSGLGEDEVISRHCAPIYRVCMMGFVPGFTFLSEAPKALHHPRHHKPRLIVPCGSVGIGGWQTGIYSLPSPGGWQIIGRTSLDIFDANRPEPFLLKAGDRLRFIPQNGAFPQAPDDEISHD
jgi:KipI family sensor histidine kinase inhibitor